MTHKQATDIQVLTVERVLGEVLNPRKYQLFKTACRAFESLKEYFLVIMLTKIS
ncbi:hypothetical protein ES703_87560 [subsurface metagenome]